VAGLRTKARHFAAFRAVVLAAGGGLKSAAEAFDAFEPVVDIIYIIGHVA
jgi:hypothetical protein